MAVRFSQPYFKVEAKRESYFPTTEQREKMRATFKKLKGVKRLRFDTREGVQNRIKQLIEEGVVSAGEVECSDEMFDLSF